MIFTFIIIFKSPKMFQTGILFIIFMINKRFKHVVHLITICYTLKCNNGIV